MSFCFFLNMVCFCCVCLCSWPTQQVDTVLPMNLYIGNSWLCHLQKHGHELIDIATIWFNVFANIYVHWTPWKPVHVGKQKWSKPNSIVFVDEIKYHKCYMTMLPISYWPCESNMDIGPDMHAFVCNKTSKTKTSDSEFFQLIVLEWPTNLAIKMEPVVPLVPLPWNGGCVSFDQHLLNLPSTIAFWYGSFKKNYFQTFQIAGGCVSCTGGVWTLFLAQLPASPVARVAAWDSRWNGC